MIDGLRVLLKLAVIAVFTVIVIVILNGGKLPALPLMSVLILLSGALLGPAILRMLGEK